MHFHLLTLELVQLQLDLVRNLRCQPQRRDVRVARPVVLLGRPGWVDQGLQGRELQLAWWARWVGRRVRVVVLLVVVWVVGLAVVRGVLVVLRLTMLVKVLVVG